MSFTTSEVESRPLPLDPLPTDGAEANRLWVGNLDSRITEYNLVKILQKFGKVAKFNFLFHKSGPLQGQPKGYCFVTYETREQAENALKHLDGKLALSKRLSVKWAYTQTKVGLTSTRGTEDCGLHSVACKDSGDTGVSISSKIQAIEAKLRLMEENKDQPEPAMPILSFINAQAPQSTARQGTTSSYRRRPYHRHVPRRKNCSRVR